jgi:hypothetical protein
MTKTNIENEMTLALPSRVFRLIFVYNGFDNDIEIFPEVSDAGITD